VTLRKAATVCEHPTSTARIGEDLLGRPIDSRLAAESEPYDMQKLFLRLGASQPDWNGGVRS